MKSKAFGRVLVHAFRGYAKNELPKSAAALAYYLFCAVFPLLLFLSTLLGRLQPDVDALSGSVSGLLPEEVLKLTEDYLHHVAEHTGGGFMWAFLALALWLTARAAGGFMSGVRRAYGLGAPTRPVRWLVRRLAYTAVFLPATALVLTLLMAGRRAMELVSARHALPGSICSLWDLLRFALAVVFMYAAVAALYALAEDRPRQLLRHAPGTVAALLGWLAVSIGFSFYVAHISDYSVLYGALGAVVVLLVWLYMTAQALLFGAEINAAVWALAEKPLAKAPKLWHNVEEKEMGGEVDDRRDT